MMTTRLKRWGVAWVALSWSGCAGGSLQPAPELEVRNNQELSYEGPLQFPVDLPDGTYAGPGGVGEIRGHEARLVTTVQAASVVHLSRTGGTRPVFGSGPLKVRDAEGRVTLGWKGQTLAHLDLGLAVIPGDSATAADAERLFRPLVVSWKSGPGGELVGRAEQSGFEVELTLAPYAGGWLDGRARVTRLAPPNGPAYVALVRRVTTAGLSGGRQQLNGRVLDGLDTPDTWSADFRYAHGTDWVSWQAGVVSLLSVSGFTPVPTIQRRDGSWAEASHYYVWEKSRRTGDSVFLFSEIAGPNPKQSQRGAMGITPYAPVGQGDSLDLRWRLAVAVDPVASWPESQWRVFAGYRAVTRAPESAAVAGRGSAGSGAATDGAAVDLGVRAVTFGTAYFPYSTFIENFDFQRVPGVNQETYWPFSATLWKQWRQFVPQMRTDLRIARAMGFGIVRLHHLELLRAMDRPEALAFLDFYMGEARALGLKVMIDTEGPPEWVTLLGRRYGDVVTRFELENEIVIGGVKPGSPERWTALYHAAKQADPTSQAFFTGAGNNGQFERMRALGVPFDRVGLHAYKHGPEWKEAYASHALGTAGYAADHGQEVTLGEFNWKELTRLSPEARAGQVDTVYREVLRPRAIPEVIEFHLQETLSVNPSIARQGIRHYEPLSLDRRPKPEGLVLMRYIREYSAADAPVRALPIEIGEATLSGDTATAPFRITNHTGHALTLQLTAEAYDGVQSTLQSPGTLELGPGATADGRVALRLAPDAGPGTYHHFLRVAYDGKTAWGWGIAAHAGAPTFRAPVLGDRVLYLQGADAVTKLDYTRPLAVAFGPDASVLELEMGYLVANTLQAATGRLVYLSSTADLPARYRDAGTVILVGTPQSNPLVRLDAAPAEGKGIVSLADGGRRLLLTGASKKDVEAAATDYVLRYWWNARDAAIRLVGTVQGAALGHKAAVGATELP